MRHVFLQPLHALYRLAPEEAQMVRLGHFIGVTKCFAGSSPGNGGDHGSTHMLVVVAECHNHSAFPAQGLVPAEHPMPTTVKIEPDDNMTSRPKRAPMATNRGPRGGRGRDTGVFGI